MGKALIIAGICLIAAGIIYSLYGKFPFSGRLPGDFAFQKGNTTIYFPLATGIVISIIATLVINIIIRLSR